MVYIIIVNWKGAFDTIRCLESIFRSTYKNYKVIVVDNLSEDDSIEIIDAWADGRLSLAEHGASYVDLLTFPPVGIKVPYLKLSAGDLNLTDNDELHAGIAEVPLVLIENTENAGFGAGNNVGLKLIRSVADCSHFWLLNNDTVITERTLSELVQSSMDYPRSVIGSMLHYYDKPDQIQAAGGGFLNRVTGKVQTLDKKTDHKLDFINGASFFAPVAYLHEVGLFDENIFMYFEESEYCIRGKIKKFNFLCCGAVVYHKHGASNFSLEQTWIEIYNNKYYALMRHWGVGFWTIVYFVTLITSSTRLCRNKSKRNAALITLKRKFKNFANIK